jgi:5-methylcytosine-specific restriction protein A
LEASDESLSVPDDSATLRRLRKRAEAEATEDPKREHVETTTSRYQRSSAVREYALKRADGICELCEEAAHFMKENGDPFLEVHHVDELGEGGADHPSLVGAICPNCHREIHYGKHGDDLNKQLRRRLESGLGDVGAVDD